MLSVPNSLQHPLISDCLRTGASQGVNDSALAVAAPAESGQCVGIRTGRPSVHASSAARKQAFRAKSHRIDLTVKTEIGATLADIASAIDCSQNELVQNLIRFALTNRNWKTLGLMGSKS